MVEKKGSTGRNTTGTIYYENESGEIQAKVCTDCNKVRSINDYNKKKRGLGGRLSKCIHCTRNRVREKNLIYYEANRENLRKRYAQRQGKDVEDVRHYRYSYEEVVALFSERGCELLEPCYTNSRTSLRYVCECGRQSSIHLSNFLKGNRCHQCGIDKITGESHWNYNPNKTDEERLHARNYPEYSTWRTAVYERDAYTCQCCGSKKSGALNAHHLDGHNWCVERRTDVTNGITLCEDCHADFHSEHGYGNNTEAQYDEWLRNKKLSNEDLGAC